MAGYRNMSARWTVSSDHRGLKLKEAVVQHLKSKGLTVEDLGPFTEDSVDYPDYALKVAESVARKQADYGVVICHSGIGVSVTANKVKGVRAALCQTAEQGELAKRHTNANVLALPAGFVKEQDAKAILDRFLSAEFEGGRHEKRLGIIHKYEDKGSQ